MPSDAPQRIEHPDAPGVSTLILPASDRGNHFRLGYKLADLLRIGAGMPDFEIWNSRRKNAVFGIQHASLPTVIFVGTGIFRARVVTHDGRIATIEEEVGELKKQGLRPSRGLYLPAESHFCLQLLTGTGVCILLSQHGSLGTSEFINPSVAELFRDWYFQSESDPISFPSR